MKYLDKVLYAAILSFSSYLSYTLAPGKLVFDQQSLQQLLVSVFVVALTSTFLQQKAGKWRQVIRTSLVLLIGYFVALTIAFVSRDNIHSVPYYYPTAIGNSIVLFALGFPYVIVKLIPALLFALSQLFLLKKILKRG